MKLAVAETLDKQNEIIKLQADIIDRLSAELLQYGMMADEDLAAIQRAVDLQKEVEA